MKIRFIQKLIDKLRDKEKFRIINNNIQQDFFELNLNLNAKEGYRQKSDFSGTVISPFLSETLPYMNMFYPNLKFLDYNENNLNIADYYFINGTQPKSRNMQIAKKAFYFNKPIYTMVIGFFYSADTWINRNIDKKYRTAVSYTIDSVVPYFDARFQSNLERMINDPNIVITEEQKERARRCIDKIVSTHLTKYNHQPIYEPKIGREGVKKVLVIDQSYGDMSIAKGWGSDYTFEKMLQSAIDENPDADIIVKTHPDTMTGKRGGYYTGLKPHDNIYTQTEPINPISLIKYADKVYVCTTQFGFEALMCGKEVHTFGMPFYAGWGITHDLLKCERRTNKRSLEEIFYLAYIEYSSYINPEKNCRCEIEEAMDYLLKLREEYRNLKNAKS